MAQTQEAKQETKTKFKPLGYRVLVQRLEPEETAKGGIILPDSAKKKQEQAKVIATGTEKKDKSGNVVPIPVSIGDVVLIEKYSGQEITLEDEEFVIVKADDLIAVIEK